MASCKPGWHAIRCSGGEPRAHPRAEVLLAVGLVLLRPARAAERAVRGRAEVGALGMCSRDEQLKMSC